MRRPHPLVAAGIHNSFGFFGVLRQLYEKVSSAMPPNLEGTKVSSGISDQLAEGYTYNYDEGHAGRFTLPPEKDVGASLAFDHVYTQDAPFDYVCEHLTFPPPVPVEDGPSMSLFFSPGLNTLHQPAPGETTTPQRLAHYVRTLLHLPMAQIHIGTSMDQGDAVVDATNAPILRGLLYLFNGLIPEAARPKVDGNTLIWEAGSLDGMQAGLSQFNFIDTPLKERFRKMFDDTKTADAKPVTFAVYSRASIEMCAALKKHYEESRKAGEKNGQIFDRLRKYVTILTIGVATSGFPDGPAYVHLSAWADPLASSMGVNGERTRGAGRDAIFVNCDTPYNKESFDNHNFGSITAQYLAIVMSANGVKDVRTLWDKGQKGELKTIEKEVKVLAAMIVLTDGLKWLWTEDEAMAGVPDGTFPEAEAARELLTAQFGEEFVKQISAAFPDEEEG